MTDLGDKGRVLLNLARDAHNPTDADRIRVRGILAARLGAAAGLGAGAAIGAAAQAATTTAGGASAAGGGTVAAVATGGALATKVVGVALVIAAAASGGVAIQHARRASARNATHISSNVSREPRRALALRTPFAAQERGADDDAPPDHAEPPPPPPVNRRDPTARPPSGPSPSPVRAAATPAHARGEARAAASKPRSVAVPKAAAAETPPSEPEAPVKQNDGNSEGIPSSSAAAMTPPTKLDLTSESRLVHNGVVALRSGQPGLALAFFDAHALFFPQGSLAVERAAERVLALAALGRKKEARAAGEEFLRAHPTSPLALRIRKRLNALDPPPAPADPH